MSHPLHFYQTLHYPIPEPAEWFYFGEEATTDYTPAYATRRNTNTIFASTASTLDRHIRLFDHIPGVTHIYLCNSASFNAPTPDSDIDLTIIAQEKRLRTVRFYSVLFTRFAGIKRTSKHSIGRMCLTFYMTHDHCNLYHIKRPHTDTYLAYWIAHAIPLYVRTGYDPHHLIQQNTWIHGLLPNLPAYHPFQGQSHRPHTPQSSSLRNILSTIHAHWRGDILEYIIKIIRLPIIRYKKHSHRKHHSIITSDTMLKFHYDKRDIIHDLLTISQHKTQ